MRYCPSCDINGVYPYTKWTPAVAGCVGDFCAGDFCMNDRVSEICHVYIVKGRYVVDTMDPDDSRFVLRMLYMSDDGVECFSPRPEHLTLWQLLVNAMEREAKQTKLPYTFNPAMWGATFPRRTGELVERSRAVVVTDLTDKLPVVLSRIVCEYYL